MLAAGRKPAWRPTSWPERSRESAECARRTAALAHSKGCGQIRQMLWERLHNSTIRLLFRLLCLAALLLSVSAADAQTAIVSRYQMYGGYSYLSNSLNGVSGHEHALNGWDFGFAIPPWHDLRFKLAAFGYRGVSQGAAEHPYFVMGGGQYGRNFGREGAFVEALGGVGNVNKNWGANGTVGDSASFSAILGGGLDTPVSAHFAIRVEGDYQYAYFQQTAQIVKGVHYYVPGLPTNFARFSTGLVWRF